MTDHHHLENKTGLTAFEIDIIVQKSVRQTFVTLGADLSDSGSVQEMQKDFAYVRRQRVGGEKMADAVRNGALLLVISGALWALWEGIKAALAVKGVQ